ncbi:MAG: hypothetical protein V3S69_03855 [Dehalococcoidales bacterium]
MLELLRKINHIRLVFRPHRQSAKEFQLELYRVYWAAYVARLADLRAEDDYNEAENVCRLADLEGDCDEL